MNQVTKKVRKPTLKDIAGRVGLSVPTVSQIINNKGNNYCSEEKKQLVRKIARELNYQPNFGYRVMTGQSTNTVGIICSQERIKREEQIADLLLTLSSQLEAKEYSVYMSSMSDCAMDNKKKIMDLIGRGCSAFIFIGTPVGITNITALLKQYNVNYIGTRPYGMDNCVRGDGAFAVQKYIEKFLNDGLENFRLVLPKRNLNNDDQYERVAGLCRAFPDMTKDELISRYFREMPYIGYRDRDASMEIFKLGYDVTEKMLSEEPEVNGIIYLSDYYALGGVRYLVEQGLTIGKDIAVAGYNNTNAAKFAGLPFMTADHRTDIISKELIDHLEDSESQQRIIKPEVIFY